jgi:hypothetical protein
MNRSRIAWIVSIFVLASAPAPCLAGGPLPTGSIYVASFAAEHSGQSLHAQAGNFGRFAVPALPAGVPAGPEPADPGEACRQAIAASEQANHVPDRLMQAIGRVESGRRNARGGVDPWPWSINVEGTDHVFDTREEAIAEVVRLEAQGIRSIDMGCMQVNLLHHPHAFATLEGLHADTGSWAAATADYHSQTPSLGAAYAQRVMAVWPQELGHAPPPGMTTLPPQLAFAAAASGPGNAFSSNVWSRNLWNSGPKMPIGSGMPLHGPPAAVIRLPAGAVGKTLASYRQAPVQLSRQLALAQR